MRQSLSVVDVYSGWCGPCKAVVGLLRRLKNEVGRSGLLFAAVSMFACGLLFLQYCTEFMHGMCVLRTVWLLLATRSASCVPVQAKTDKITALEKYRERSQPCFLFLAVSLAALWGTVLLSQSKG